MHDGAFTIDKLLSYLYNRLAYLIKWKIQIIISTVYIINSTLSSGILFLHYFVIHPPCLIPPMVIPINTYV